MKERAGKKRTGKKEPWLEKFTRKTKIKERTGKFKAGKPVKLPGI